MASEFSSSKEEEREPKKVRRQFPSPPPSTPSWDAVVAAGPFYTWMDNNLSDRVFTEIWPEERWNFTEGGIPVNYFFQKWDRSWHRQGAAFF